MKKFDYTFREGLPGGPNEVKGRVKGSVTKTGYKRNSPDVDNDFNVIPSPYITMVGVDFPVYGEDNLGNGQVMYPGENYEFPGDYVTEMPAYGSGGLTQWFAEEWVDVKTGKKCGRSGKDKKGRPYPACRPSKRVNKTTPKTTKEMSAKEKAKFKKSKTSKKRINYNHKRKAQEGIEVEPASRRIRYEDGRIKLQDPAIYDGMLDETTVTPYTQSELAFQEARANQATGGLEPTYPIFDVMTLGLRTPVTAGAKAVQAGIKKAPSKINPRYFQPNSNMYYRGIGREGMEDALESGLFRAKPSDKIPARMVDLGPNLGKVDMAKRFNKTYYSPRFNTADQYGAGYIAEVPKDAAKFTQRYQNTDWSMFTRDQIPVSEGRILEKNWWSGYKPIKAYGGSLYKAQEGVEVEPEGYTNIYGDYIAPGDTLYSGPMDPARLRFEKRLMNHQSAGQLQGQYKIMQEHDRAGDKMHMIYTPYGYDLPMPTAPVGVQAVDLLKEQGEKLSNFAKGVKFNSPFKKQYGDEVANRFLPPAIRNMQPKEDPIYYDGIVGETTVTAPRAGKPSITDYIEYRKQAGEAIPESSAYHYSHRPVPTNTNFSFIGADKSGGLSALKAIGKGVKGLLGLKSSADDAYKYVQGIEDFRSAAPTPVPRVTPKPATAGYKKGFGNPYENLSITDDMFKGPANYGVDYTGEIAKGRLDFVKGLGKELDDINFDANWISPEHLRFHGSPAGRSVIEVAVPGKTHQTQLFYKSSGLAGKSGQGVKGTTQGLWQPYGGHATLLHPQGPVDNWFIKDGGYENFYNSKSYRDIANRLDDLVKEAGFDLSGQAYKYQEGGENEDAMIGMMKARIALDNEFGNNPAIQRLIVAPDNPYDFGDGDTGTHYMGSYGNYAIPNIQDVNGQLQMTGPRMNEAIRFDRPEDAEYFAAENYKKVAPAFKKQKGGPAGTYTVKSGDTFYGIANRQGVDKNALVNANPDLDIDNLKVGQSIQLPGMNPNYVLSNKGVVSMSPEAYSTVSDGYKGQSFIDDALAKSQPKLSGYLDMDNTLKYLVQSRGNTPEFWTNTADTIAYHESAHTMNPKMKQYDDGPARGMFQFEGPAFQTFKNRYRNVAKALNLKTDPEMLSAKSADELPADKQYTAFLVNLLESDAVLKDYADGNMSLEDLWLSGHKNKEAEGDRRSFNTSVQKARREGITGGYQDVKQIGGEKTFDPSIFNTNPELTKSFEKIVTSSPQATMQAAPSPEEAFAEMPVFDQNAVRKNYLDQANVRETTVLDPKPTPLEKQFFEKDGVQEALRLQETEYQAPDLFINYTNNVNSQSREEFDAINNKYYKKYTAANKPAVTKIQQSLVQQGYLQPDQIDGFFGPVTKKALKASRNQTTIDSDLIPSELSDKRCAAGMCSILDSQGLNTANLGLKYKNAWDILESTQEKGTANVVYNIYDDEVFNGVESADDIKRATVQAKRKSQTTPDMYSVGDIVGVYWPNSKYHAETKNSKTHNTHVGFVSEIRNGIPIITHNVSGNVKQDPYNKLVTGWISRPTGIQQVKSQYSPKDWDKTDLRPEVLENWKAKTEVSDPDPERFKTVENVLKRVNYNANALPQRLGSNVDPNWLREAVSGVLGNESAVGYNTKRSRQEVEESDRLRAIAYKVKDIDDGDISIGVGKIKFSQLDPFAKSFFDVKSPEDLGNDLKNVDVTTYNMIKHYDMFADYASKFPELGLTESDVKNMSILSHNQGSSRLLKLGRNADFKTVEEEVQSLRNLYDSEISDVSSTNWKYFGDTLGNLAFKTEGLIKGNDPSFETYISKGNRWGKWLYDRDPNSITRDKDTPTLYDYMKSNSIDATYNNRRKLYESYLKEDYKGTAEQNNKLLMFLQHLNSSDLSLAINRP